MEGNSLELRPDWRYAEHDGRRHYVLEAWNAGVFAGRAYGWIVPGARCVLEKIEIEPAFRGNGYGTAVIERIRRQARQEGCGELVIEGVLRSNRGAIRLYESLGASRLQVRGDLEDYVLSPP